MNDADFDFFCKMVRDRSGLVLGPDKAYLVKGRLESVARAEGFADVPALLTAIRKGAPEKLHQRCVDALATHESSFFRDAAPFEVLKADVLPELLDRRASGRRLRIWCAACSSGQEPFSIAMIINELAGLRGVKDVEILATDFSEPILAKARAGIYSDFEVRRGLSPERLQRWFQREGDAWRIDDQLRRMVTFKAHNLLSGAGALGQFDIVFCRNVLIYFEPERKRFVLNELSRAMTPEGALLLGSAETILGLTDALQPLPGARGMFRSAPSAMARAG